MDLTKAYDRVNWYFLRLTLHQVGFSRPFINWVFVFFQSVSSIVQINGSASSFSSPNHGLRQGFALVPLLFILVMEGLSRDLSQA